MHREGHQSLRKQAKESLKNLFHHKKHTDEADTPQATSHDSMQNTALPKQISNLGAIPKDLMTGMDANKAQSASGAPSRLSEVARDQAPPLAKVGGAGHVPPPDQPASAARHVMAQPQHTAPATPEAAGYARLNAEEPLAPAPTPVGGIPSSGGSGHPPPQGVATASVKRAGMGENPAMGANLAKTGVSEDAALAAQAHALHHTTDVHDTSVPYLGPSTPSGPAAAKPNVTDVGAKMPPLAEQKEPLLPSGKHSSPVTGYVPSGVLHKEDKPHGGDIEQDSKMPTGYLGSEKGAEALKAPRAIGDRGMTGKTGGTGLGSGSVLKEHADASKEQDAKSMGMEAAKREGGAAAVPEAGLPSPTGEGLTKGSNTSIDQGTGQAESGSQASNTLLGRAQEAIVHAAAATSAAGTVVVNKVSEATGLASNKAKGAGEEAQQQARSATGERAPGGNGTGIVQKAQETAQGAYQQVASSAPLQRVVEYGQAAASKATEQAQAAYEAATNKLHETGLPQKAAEHRDAASAKASDLASQAQQSAGQVQQAASEKAGQAQQLAAQAQQVAAEKAAQLQEAARAKAAELYTQAADTTVAAREQAARKANELYMQASDQAVVARDKAAQALGEGIDKVANASEDDINRSKLARGLAMVTLLWVLCMVLGIPLKFALTVAFLAVGGMMLKEFWQDKHGARLGGRGPHGGVKTTEFSAHTPEGRDITPHLAGQGAHATESQPVSAAPPQPPMLGQSQVSSVTPQGGPTLHSSGMQSSGMQTSGMQQRAPAPAEHPTVEQHTEFGKIKVAKPVMDSAAHHAAKLVEE